MLPLHVLRPVGYAFLLIVVSLLVLGLSLGAWRGTRAPVAAALLVGIGTVSAACVAALVWEYKARLDQQAKQLDDARERQERVVDIIVAIQADIESDIEQLKEFNAQRDEHIGAFEQRIEAKEKYAMPRGVQSTKGLILAAIEKDITVLPRKLMKSIINYYEHDIDMSLMLTAFTEGKFDKLAAVRQRELALGYYALGPKAQSAAEEALKAINLWLAENNS